MEFENVVLQEEEKTNSAMKKNDIDEFPFS